MRSRLLLCLAFATVLYSRGAAAHNAAHAAVAVLAADEQGVSMVRLTRGLAYRSDDGFRFVCPEVWGGDIAAPSSAIPGGPAVVAAEQLYLIEPSGRIAPHPTHTGAGIALARNREALFGLFRVEGRVELRRITPTTSELLAAFDEPFGALAASDSGLSLLRASQRDLILQQLTLDGEPRERVSWGEPSAIATATLHASGDQLYATLVHSAAPWLTLGRIADASYEQLRSANSAFAGPVALGSDALIVRDGTLELLAGGRSLSRATFVECLDGFAGLNYACVGDGLSAVDGDGLGAPLFDMTSLREPDYERLSAAQREDCASRWRDLRDHLLLEGRIPPQPSEIDEASEQADAPDDETPATARPSACTLGVSSARVHALSALAILVLLGLWRRYSASEL